MKGSQITVVMEKLNYSHETVLSFKISEYFLQEALDKVPGLKSAVQGMQHSQHADAELLLAILSALVKYESDKKKKLVEDINGQISQLNALGKPSSGGVVPGNLSFHKYYDPETGKWHATITKKGPDKFKMPVSPAQFGIDAEMDALYGHHLQAPKLTPDQEAELDAALNAAPIGKEGAMNAIMSAMQAAGIDPGSPDPDKLAEFMDVFEKALDDQQPAKNIDIDAWGLES